MRISEKESWRRETLRALSLHLRVGLRDLGIGDAKFADGRPATPIVPVILGEPARALAVSQLLEKQGFLVTAIRPPTVPAGTARLRITLSAAHDETQVDALLAAVASAVKA